MKKHSNKVLYFETILFPLIPLLPLQMMVVFVPVDEEWIVNYNKPYCLARFVNKKNANLQVFAQNTNSNE